MSSFLTQQKDETSLGVIPESLSSIQIQFNEWNRVSLFYSLSGIEAVISALFHSGIEFKGNSGPNSLLNFAA